MKLVSLVWLTACAAGAHAPPSPPPALALAADLPAVCSDIQRIDRPVATDDPALGTFSYGYRFEPPTTAGAPVLVYLPGGPGMTSIDQVPGFLPAGWGYLLTDPRGVGCNRLAALPPPDVSGAFFRTSQLAGDVIAAIVDRQLDGYLVFGISYGTELATEVAAGLDSAPTPAPIAIVMEGVLGRAFQPGEYYAIAGIAQWNRLRATMPGDVRSEFDTAASPFGISQEGWSRALGSILLGGTAIVSLELAALSTTTPASIRDQALAAVHTYSDHPELADPASVELFRQIACREIDDTAPADDLDPIFDHGQLVRNAAQAGTKCGALHVTTPYDSAAFPFTTPMYDFIGSVDVATPPWQGAYHYDHHAGPAVRVITQQAGHLSLELDQQLCAPDVLASIAGGGTDLADVLGWCPLAVELDAK